jgi:NADH dehydrogenase FAD-containing subunit
VLAVGATHGYFGHPEWERFAPGLKTVEDAVEIRRRFLLAFERAENATDEAERRACMTFVVVGGGPTGVELAGAMAEIARTVLPGDFRVADPRTPASCWSKARRACCRPCRREARPRRNASSRNWASKCSAARASPPSTNTA